MALPKLQRPAWTVCFGIILVLLLPASLMTHIAVGKVAPSITNLVENMNKGFKEAFRIGYMSGDAAAIKTASAGVVVSCEGKEAIVADVCALAPKENTQIVLTGDAKTTVKTAFDSTFSIVGKVAADKYLGTDAMSSVLENSKKIKEELDKIEDQMQCTLAIPTFCSLYTTGDSLETNMVKVNKQMDDFTKAKEVQDMKDKSGFLNYLHAMPYVLVLSLLCFTVFWWKGGVCCCCKDGTIAGILLIPFFLLWLVAFVLFTIVFAAGMALKMFGDQLVIPASVLKGEPTFPQICEHLQTEYPKFWKLAFADLEDGLLLLWNAAIIFLVVEILILLYSCCECCCRPYAPQNVAPKEAGAPAPAAAPTEPTAEPDNTV